jgi:hypothetical protein
MWAMQCVPPSRKTYPCQNAQQFAVETCRISEYHDNYCDLNTKIQTLDILSPPLRSQAWNTNCNTVSFRGPVARNIIWNFNIASKKHNIVVSAGDSVYAIIFYFIWISFLLFYYIIISFSNGCIRRGYKHFIHISYFPYTIGSFESIIMFCVCGVQKGNWWELLDLGVALTLEMTLL